MELMRRWRVAAASVVAAVATFALSACIITPGTFDATLDLRKDGEFTFSYNGQIYLLALAQLADAANKAETGDEEFTASTCYDDDDFEERPCTDEEVAEQRQVWEDQAETRAAAAKRDSEMMSAVLGGIDPTDPEAAEELAERLRRQAGWKRVDYRGDGLFDVEFSITSRMGHDFNFPTFERLPMSNSFVLANLRQGNQLRIEAPGFSTQGNGNPLQSMMTGFAGLASAYNTTGAGEETGLENMPDMQGTFRIITDGKVLANNTDEGPQAGTTGQILEWKVNRRTQSPPMALIQLGN
ncbi:hypothetical protein ASD76_06625 [Altererythrobacter sp. Root672]|nr:hypothetical protein ASD76_06625 [Altererythrobacter sp. Root672]